MKKILYIAFLLVSFAFTQTQVSGQDLPVACGGSKVRYGVTGLSGSTFVWTVDGGTISVNYNDSIDVTWDYTPGVHQITVTEHTSTLCIGDVQTGLVMVSIPQIPELGSDLTICQGQTISIASSYSSYTSYLWSTGATSESIDATTQGWYKLTATDANGCSASDSVYLTVNALPNVSITFQNNDSIICGSVTSITLDAGNGGSDYLWSNDRNNNTWSSSIYTVTEAAQYTVKVTDGNGCVNSDAVKVGVCDVHVPNAFTPNNDGDNDTWKIPDLETYPNASVEIYDRWGRLVYKAGNGYPSEGWDGTSKGRNLPMDSYFYFIKLNDGSNKTEKGSVTIIR